MYRATHPKAATTPKHAIRIIASMCSREKNGPSCAKAEAEVKMVIKRITDLIEAPSVNVVSRCYVQIDGRVFRSVLDRVVDSMEALVEDPTELI